MKNTRYFPDYQSAYIYYGGTDVPSTEIALVGDGSYIFVSSDNSYSGNTQYFDANTTNDVIVQNMTTSAYNMGVSYGYDYGYPIGYTAGTAYGEATTYPVAYAAGEAYGYTTGHTAGYTEGEAYGYTTGHTAGYTEGYSYGFSAGDADVSYADEYFTVESLAANNSLTITKGYSETEKVWYWSKDKNNWSSFTETTTISVGLNEKVYFYSEGACSGAKMHCTGNYKVSGNIMSILFGQNFANQTTLNYGYGTSACGNLFDESQANEHTLLSAGNLILAATTVSWRCYYGMFYQCSAMTEAPALPATTLAYQCYQYMFYGCTSLTKAPMLPATTLATDCYIAMFWFCSNLKYLPYVAASNDFGLENVGITIIKKAGTTVTAGSSPLVYEYDPTTQSSLWSDDPEEFMLNVITNAILNA